MVTHPQWCKNVSIYQLNTRQYTPEGTLAAAAHHLPRIKELGCDVVWLMPIHEIGHTNRKGSLGSPYSVRDYYSVNAELGTLDDLRAFVDTAHELDMHVILDWVANHTAWDNPLTHEHPDWYRRDWKGDFTPTPWWDWDDIIELDYANPEVHTYMREAMAYWVRHARVDGFRCDVAGYVPTDFWAHTRQFLEQMKPIFLLGEYEWDTPAEHQAAFDMTYGKTWIYALQSLATGSGDTAALRVYYSWDVKSFPPSSIRMMPISHHDLNAWEGTEFERFGPMREAAIVLSVLGRGMPLVYSGQEAGLDRRLKFFDRDTISWREHPQGQLYQKLLHLKKSTSALWNGPWGAPMIPVPNSCQQQVLSFVRRNEQHQVFAVFNFSSQQRQIHLREQLYPGSYIHILTGEQVVLPAGAVMELPAWGWWAGVGSVG